MWEHLNPRPPNEMQESWSSELTLVCCHFASFDKVVHVFAIHNSNVRKLYSQSIIPNARKLVRMVKLVPIISLTCVQIGLASWLAKENLNANVARVENHRFTYFKALSMMWMEEYVLCNHFSTQ